MTTVRVRVVQQGLEKRSNVVDCIFVSTQFDETKKINISLEIQACNYKIMSNSVFSCNLK